MDNRVLPFIQSHSVFGSLGRQSQERLARGSLLRVFDPGERIFAQGDEGRACYALCFGRVKVHQVSGDGKDILVKLLGEGDIFGEVILFDQRPYPAHAVAVESSTVIEIPRQVFFDLLDDPAFRNDFIMTILAKLRYLGTRVFSLMAYDVEERFFLYILETWGNREEYRVGISKKDFAQAIATIPETFSRLIARLRERGDIEWEGPILRVRESIRNRYAGFMES